MKLIEIRSATVTEKGQIAIPKEIRKMKGFKEGSKIAILAFEDRIEIRPMKEISEKMVPYTMSHETLAKSWLSKEDEKAWKHLQKET